MADNTPDKNIPQIQWLRGNEIALFPDGHFAAIDKTMANNIVRKVPDNFLKHKVETLKEYELATIREAVAIWPTGELPVADDLKKFADPKLIGSVRSKISEVGRGGYDTIKLRKTDPYIWNAPYNEEVSKLIKQHTLENEQAVFKKLLPIARDAESLLSGEDVQSFFEKISPENFFSPVAGNIKRILDDESFAKDKHIIESASVFTADIAQLFAYEAIPIAIAPRLNAQLKAIGINNEHSFVMSYQDGVVFDHETIESLGKSAYDDHQVARNIARALIAASAASIGTGRKELGLNEPDKWSKITAEFKNNCQKIMDAEQYTLDAAVPGDYAATDILAQMHFALHSGFYNPDEVRKDFPESVKMYDKFIESVQKRVRERKKKPLYNPLQPSKIVKQAVDIEEANEIAPEKPTPENQIHSLNLSALDFNPKPFTNDEREQELLQVAKPFLEEALNIEPPCNQFRCQLVLNDNNTKDNYPVRLTFRNANGVTKGGTVYTGTGDLDEATELKKILQSHILNNENIVPLYMRVKEKTDEPETITQSEAIVPNTEPAKVRLVNSGHYYAASITFPAENNAHEDEVIIPLGIRYEPQKTNIVNEAERRLEYVGQHLQKLRESNRWETLGEIAQHLKHNVLAEHKASGWRMADTQRLDYYGDKEKDLAFPMDGSQSTILKSVSLRLIEGASEPNSTWRLQYTIDVKNVGEHGNETMEYRLSQNLHTNDEFAAQLRGIEAIESLVSKIEELSKTHPSLHWELENNQNVSSGRVSAGQLALRLGDGTMLPDPEPQNLFHLVEDMPNPKVNFQINHILNPSNNPGKEILTLTVQRGSKTEDDLVDFNNLRGKTMSRSFEVDADKPQEIESLLAALNHTFRNNIEDAYGNRTGAGHRKTRQ